MSKSAFTFFIFYMIPYICIAQKTVAHTNQQWLQYVNQSKISSKLNINSDASLRSRNSFGELSALTIRSGLAYQMISNLMGVTGFGCFTGFTENKVSRVEFRPYQEVNTSQSFSKFNVVHRFRVEGRFFKKVVDGSFSSEDSFNYRFRYRIMAMVPLLKFSKSNTDRRIIINIGNELFINAGKEIIYNSLDNNRLSVGLTFQNSKKLSATLTYVYQYGQRANPGTYEKTNIITLVFHHKMNQHF